MRVRNTQRRQLRRHKVFSYRSRSPSCVRRMTLRDVDFLTASHLWGKWTISSLRLLGGPSWSAFMQSSMLTKRVCPKVCEQRQAPEGPGVDRSENVGWQRLAFGEAVTSARGATRPSSVSSRSLQLFRLETLNWHNCNLKKKKPNILYSEKLQCFPSFLTRATQSCNRTELKTPAKDGKPSVLSASTQVWLPRSTISCRAKAENCLLGTNVSH